MLQVHGPHKALKISFTYVLTSNAVMLLFLYGDWSHLWKYTSKMWQFETYFRCNSHMSKVLWHEAWIGIKIRHWAPIWCKAHGLFNSGFVGDWAAFPQHNYVLCFLWFFGVCSYLKEDSLPSQICNFFLS